MCSLCGHSGADAHLVKRDLHLWHTMLPCSWPPNSSITGDLSRDRSRAHSRSACPASVAVAVRSCRDGKSASPACSTPRQILDALEQPS